MVMAGTLYFHLQHAEQQFRETENPPDTLQSRRNLIWGYTGCFSADSGNKKLYSMGKEIFSDDANTKMEERLKEYGKRENVTVKL